MKIFLKKEMLDKSLIKNLNIIKNENGDVLHGLKKTDDEFNGFGEVYFSTVYKGSIKPWKRHLSATLNLIVIVGKVRFVLIEEEDSNFKISEFTISNPDNYCRLTIPSETWFAFQGIEENNIIMSVSSLIHDPNEVERKDLSSFDYDWSKN